MALTASAPEPQIFLGIDYGMKRMGLAVATSLTEAQALTTVVHTERSVQLKAIAAAIAEWRVTDLVLGVPLSSQNQLLHNAIRKLAHQLQGHFKLPLHLVDESHSSAEASARLKDKGVHGRAQKTALDEEAACVILNDWLQRL